MKVSVPEISWHNRDPVYTLDFQPKINPNENFQRLASGGADCHVVIWHVTLNNEEDKAPTTIEFAADLHRHIKGVNAVRFSPNGELLASGDDDAMVILWRPRIEVDLPELPSASEEKESWVSLKVLRGHMEDIYDLAWSPDSSMLATGSVDNTAIQWDVNKGKSLGFLGEHKGFVQGVAWDPQNKFIATLSTDRALRIINVQTRKTVARASKAKFTYDNTETGDKETYVTKLFHDDAKTFFRRLTFTPGGELLIAPCGIFEDQATDKPVDVTYVFTRSSFSKPVLHYPSPNQYSVAVRCCPIRFMLRREPTNSLFDAPYRVVFAVATKSTLMLYDTEQTQPFAFISNVHYTGLTDVAWSSDGRMLFVSSSEGYCSVVTFDENEIGTPYEAVSPDKTKAKVEGNSKQSVKTGDVEEIKVANTTDMKMVEKTLEKPKDEKTESAREKQSESEVQTIKDDVEMREDNPEKNVVKEMTNVNENKEESLIEEEKNNDMDVEMIDDSQEIQNKVNENIMNDINHEAKEMNSGAPDTEMLFTKNKGKLTPTKTNETKNGDNDKEDKKEKCGGTDEITSCASIQKTDEGIFKTPKKVPPSNRGTPPRAQGPDSPSNWSLTSQLSLCLDVEEDDLMSEVEQAKRLLASPVASSTRTPNKEKSPAATASPSTPGRRVELICLSSPKSPRVSKAKRKLT